MNISVSNELKSLCPEFKGAAVEAWVTNTPYNEGLWQEINSFTEELRAESDVADVRSNMPLPPQG